MKEKHTFPIQFPRLYLVKIQMQSELFELYTRGKVLMDNGLNKTGLAELLGE